MTTPETHPAGRSNHISRGAPIRCAMVLFSLTILQQFIIAQTSVTITMIRSGLGHTLALMSDGTVRAWGRNSEGQLGLGHTLDQSFPQTIPGLSGVTSISVGGRHNMALLSNQTVMTWGSNNYGQLGIGNGPNQSTPQLVLNLPSVTAVSAGADHCLALGADGGVKAWGRNQRGQLGIYSYVTQYVPVTAIAPNTSQTLPISNICAGGYFSYARYLNAGWVAWGDNTYGQCTFSLSGGTTVLGPMSAAGIIQGHVSVVAGKDHVLALHASGTVKAAGRNHLGQLGIGNLSNVTTSFVTVTTLSGVVELAAGADHSMARMSDGSVKSWGLNSSGQLGGQTASYLNQPYLVYRDAGTLLAGTSAISAGWNSSFALTTASTLYAWGLNDRAQLGLVTTTNQTWPQLVQSISCMVPYSFSVGPIGSSAVGFAIPCNAETGGRTSVPFYQNFFTADPLNATSPGTGPWFGLHANMNEIVLWLSAGQNGLNLAYGALDVLGSASASVAVPPAALAGITLYGVSVALDPLTMMIIADSGVASHTF